MVRSAIQLYTLRELDESIPEMLDRVADTSFDGVEFAGIGRTPPEEIAETLESTGLDAASAHVGLEEIESDFRDTIAAYETIGCEHLVVGYLDESHFATPTAIADTAKRLSDVGDWLDDSGFTLSYHNHAHEFVDLGDRTAFELLIEETTDDVHFELDVGWTAAGGLDPGSLIERLGERSPLLHFKDMSLETGNPVEIGAGDIDMGRCAAAAGDATDWFIYEHDHPADPVESLGTGAKTIADLITAHKR